MEIACRKGSISDGTQQFKKAATHGNADAQALLGSMYYDGDGVPQDYARALEWYKKAAAQGNADAQSNLGLIYENGQGVPRSDVHAAQCFIVAKAGGLAAADKLLSTLEQNMTPTQITEAQRLASEWLATHHKQPEQQH